VRAGFCAGSTRRTANEARRVAGATQKARQEPCPSIAKQAKNGNADEIEALLQTPRLLAACLRGATRNPVFPAHETQSEPPVVDPQIAILPKQHRVSGNLRDLLRHDADIGLIVPEIPIAVKSDTELPDSNDSRLTRMSQTIE
jgi:hypothetical protein